MSASASDKADAQQANITATAASDPEGGRAETQSQTGPLRGRVREALSRYDDMVLATDRVPFWNNILSSFFSWLLLAGFLVLPGTFSNLDEIKTSSGDLKKVIHAVRNLPLFVVAYCVCAISTTVLLWLWWRQWNNYVWLLRNIFVPGIFNGLSGLITTFVSVYATQKDQFGPSFGASSITTLVVTAACTVICSFLAVIYTILKLRAYKVPAKPRDSEKGKEKKT